MGQDTTSLPKYVQLSEMLIREIAAGRLMDGERLAPERVMARDLGVAVGTLRKALADLEGKGLLERIHGSGNYVRHRAEIASIYALFRLELIDGGGLPTARVLDCTRLDKPDDLPEFGRSHEACRIRRVRYLSGTPAALEEIWLDCHWGAGLEGVDFSESLYLTYRKQLGLSIVRADDRIGVGRFPGWAKVETLPAEAPCGLVERLGISAEGEAAEFSRTWFDSDKCRYVSRIR